VHHGPTTNPELAKYRKRALKLTRKLCDELGVEFYGVRVKPRQNRELRSEAALRKARHQAFDYVATKISADYVCLGHHADDLFETRLIRLIRGTGSQGLQAMHEKGGRFLRPLLSESRNAIRAYAKYANLRWIEDPSNEDPGPLRNWLRHVWIPELEKKRAGGAAAFARSLEVLAGREGHVESANSVDLVAKLESQRGQIDRERYMRLGVSERRQVLASLLKQLNANGFTRNHIEEIRKRIETPKRFTRFEILGFLFQVNAEQVLLERH
jgi:tRNA(Ile)-lysidine synthase